MNSEHTYYIEHFTIIQDVDVLVCSLKMINEADVLACVAFEKREKGHTVYRYRGTADRGPTDWREDSEWETENAR